MVFKNLRCIQISILYTKDKIVNLIIILSWSLSKKITTNNRLDREK